MPSRNYASPTAGRRISPSDGAAWVGGHASKTSRHVYTSRRQLSRSIYLSGTPLIIHVQQVGRHAE